MKKTLLASAITAAIFSTATMAAPTPKLVDYFNVSMGSQAVDSGVSGVDLDSGMSLIGTIGKDLNEQVQNLSAEVEMSKSVSKAGTTIAGTDYDSDVFSMGGYAVYNFPASPQFTFRGKAGVLYDSVTADQCTGGTCTSNDDTNFGLSYGVGATWKLQKNFNVLGEYTIVHSDVSNLALGIKYDFE